MTYAKKLRHPKWQKRRLDVLNRDGFKCQLCGDEETTLNVHHKEYIKGCEPWDYEDEVLITYCEDCHLLVEFLKKDCPKILVFDFNVLKLRHKSVCSLIIRVASNNDCALFFYDIINGEVTYNTCVCPSEISNFKNFING